MYPTIIQDNLFQNPYEIIEISKKLKFYPPNKKENFAGTRTKSLHKTHKELYLKIISNVVGNYYFNKKVNFTNTTVHFSKIKKKDRGRTHIHYDKDCEIASVVYLSKGAIDSGTTLYNKNNQKQIIVSNDFNSLVSYDGSKLHGATNLDLLEERLTINIFIGKVIIVS
tara:strand:- start:1345 stop:1848 length:504 start_codon:yes stop_codon:yes gene_type:complete